MRVLGIDPGSETTGWGVIESEGRKLKLVEFGVVCASPRESFPTRLLKIFDGIEQVIARLKPTDCSVEEAFYAANVKTALKLGQVRGAVLVAAERAKLEIHEYSPRLVKQTVVGYGNAEKHQVQEMVRLLLALSHVPEPHDAADALANAICHFHHAGSRERILAAEARIKLASRSSTATRRRAPR
jgi:crossover junction endodeoxyribonuclease RuvC